MNQFVETFESGNTKVWGFTHLAYGREKDVAIAHITYIKRNGDELFEWAVVRHPNLEEGYWSHAIEYVMSYEDAKKVFWNYMEKE